MISLTSPVETRAHTWPAGAKLLALCGATVVLFTIDGVLLNLSILIAVAVIYALPGKDFLKAGVRLIWVLWPFVVMVVLWQALFGVAADGIVTALRMVTAVALANLVTMTTRLSDMIGVVHKLMAPLRWVGISTRPVELAIAMVVRFTPVLAQKGSALNTAWRARSPKGASWRIVTPFAVLAIDDAEQVADALKARGGL